MESPEVLDFVCPDCHCTDEMRPAYGDCPMCKSKVLTRELYHLREKERLAAWQEWVAS